MQPYLFPYLGYFQLLSAVDTFVCLDDVNFIKKGWIHRNNFLLNGEPKLFTFALSKISQNRLIKDHQFADIDGARRDFMQLMEQSYSAAPNYRDVLDLLKRIFSIKTSVISDFISHSLREICLHLNVKTEIISSSDIAKDAGLTGQDRIIEIVKKCGGGRYINPVGGISLYDGGAFAREGIRLSFLQTMPVTYRQFGDPFTPNLSIVDLLMFNTNESMDNFLRKYELIAPQ